MSSVWQVFFTWSHLGSLNPCLTLGTQPRLPTESQAYFELPMILSESEKPPPAPRTQGIKVLSLYTSFTADFPGGSEVKRLSAIGETQVRSLGWEDLLEKGMATHSSILAWRIPGMEEPGRLQSMGLQRVRHDWATSFLFTSQHRPQFIRYVIWKCWFLLSSSMKASQNLSVWLCSYSAKTVVSTWQMFSDERMLKKWVNEFATTQKSEVLTYWFTG